MSILDNTITTKFRGIIFNTFGWIDSILGKKNDLFILCYHAIGNDNWRYGIKRSEIVRQVKWLLKTHSNVSLKDIELHIKGKKHISQPSFAITFDDGYKDILEVKDIFLKMGIKPTVFILADTKNANRKELENNRKFLNKSEIFRLKKSGWDIECHGMTHAFLPKTESFDREIVEAKKKIKRDMNINTEYIAYPKGGYTQQVLEIVCKAGFKMGLSMDDGVINQNTNIFAVPRIGVDRSHSFKEFKYLFSPTVCKIRGFIKDHHFI
jgi:peptidoglycan/xylan/chitin deacetylase (PgdA/CDA1 family)